VTVDARLEQLAHRVQWLDRRRRRISIAVGVVFAIAGIVFLPGLFGLGWSCLHGRISMFVIAIVVGVAIASGGVLAFAIDVALGGTLAVWEIEHDRLSRDRGLPRAVLRRPRRRS
jgi:hypothetical protein